MSTVFIDQIVPQVPSLLVPVHPRQTLRGGWYSAQNNSARCFYSNTIVKNRVSPKSHVVRKLTVCHAVTRHLKSVLRSRSQLTILLSYVLAPRIFIIVFSLVPHPFIAPLSAFASATRSTSSGSSIVLVFLLEGINRVYRFYIIGSGAIHIL